MFMRNKAMRNAVLSLNNILIVSPDVIIGASFLILFTMIGVKLGFASVLISHIAFSIPIVVIMVLPKLQEMSPTLIDAALDLGATKRDVLTRVIIPFIKPGILAGFFLALTYSLDDFAVTFFVTGNGSLLIRRNLLDGPCWYHTDNQCLVRLNIHRDSPLGHRLLCD